MQFCSLRISPRMQNQAHAGPRTSLRIAGRELNSMALRQARTAAFCVHSHRRWWASGRAQAREPSAPQPRNADSSARLGRLPAGGFGCQPGCCGWPRRQCPLLQGAAGRGGGQGGGRPPKMTLGLSSTLERQDV